ncbi:MAG: M15 family metallopeptidase [Saprospiraceae bacterium]|nr:M15 family metallopeptidase [Saprospiraceae bacterium]
MHAEAQKSGVNLTIVSATRNNDYQKGIWEKKWNTKAAAYKVPLTQENKVAIAKDILKFSSMPGTSRHHWGTDIDLNDLEPEYFQKGPGKKVYDWLNKNAAEYGFCQTYTSKSWGRQGYEEESWHWSYMPLSDNYLKEYIKQVKLEDICCFAGSDVVKSLDVINVFVEGINPGCGKI